MDIKYKSKKLYKICTNGTMATKTYGQEMAKKIHLRIDQITAAESVEFLILNNIGRCHRLTGNRDGQYAMDLVHPARFVFTIDKSGCIQVAEIIEIIDYH